MKTFIPMDSHMLPLARSELILGGQKSGKSRRAIQLARQWLDQSPGHRAVLIATAQAWDAEMRQRIARHQRYRAQRVPGIVTIEEQLHLAQAMTQHSTPDTLLVVDCLTLWLTNWLMPAGSHDSESNQRLALAKTEETALLLIAIAQAPGPVILVGNEIGLGVIPTGRAVREFVDALGRLNQDVAATCQRVSLVAAGLPLVLKDSV